MTENAKSTQSRERFRAACEHRVLDRCPVDYLAHPDTDKKLRDFYGVKTERELLDRLGSDFYYLSVRDISQNETSLPIYRGPALDLTENERACPLGIRWTRGAGRSKFFVDEAIFHPLADAATSEDILRHPWPKPEWFDVEPLGIECEENSDRVIVGGFWSGIFGDCYRMMGFEKFLLNMAANPELIETLVHRMTDFHLQMNDRMFSALKGKLDVFFFGNDFGTQAGLMFSRRMCEEFFYENIRGLASLAHGYGIRVMMHSCGGISEIIPGLIEAGVDILDPVQVTAKGMSPAVLKKDFGERMVFHGGIDTQHVLPFETPEGVHRHASEIMNTLGEGGGYIFAPSQILGPDIPVENIHAMYNTPR